jgi:hypothetical protein
MRNCSMPLASSSVTAACGTSARSAAFRALAPFRRVRLFVHGSPSIRGVTAGLPDVARAALS